MGQKKCHKVRASPNAIVKPMALHTHSHFPQRSSFSNIHRKTKIQMKMNIYPSDKLCHCATQCLLKLNMFFDKSIAYVKLHRAHVMLIVNTKLRDILSIDYSSNA